MQVFVDESERRDYLVCAVVVRGDIRRLRTAVRRLCRPGQRRVHFSKEGDPRRRSILSEFVELGVRARVYTSPSSVKEGRESCLRALIADIAPIGAERLVIESRSAMDRLDDAVIKAALRKSGPGRLTYEHATAYQEPLLWLPDAIGWAVGRGGEWKRRTEPLLEEMTQLGP